MPISLIKVSKVYDKTDTLIKNLGIQDNNKDSVKYNSALLAMYGTSKYDNVNKVMVRIIVIILSLISIGCTIVIYNSFAISVMERKTIWFVFKYWGN